MNARPGDLVSFKNAKFVRTIFDYIEVETPDGTRWITPARWVDQIKPQVWKIEDQYQFEGLPSIYTIADIKDGNALVWGRNTVGETWGLSITLEGLNNAPVERL